MCDNKNNIQNIIKEPDTPCNNDQVSIIRNVISNNLNILACFKSMKCAVISYINALSVDFVQNIDHGDKEPLERLRFNILIESLIAGIHQSIKSHTNGQIQPYFQLWIQKDDGSGNNTYDLGKGWINNTEQSGCFDNNDDAIADTYTVCTNAEGVTAEKYWVGREHDQTYDAGNITKLFPSKISLIINCNLNNGIKGDEILYHYNPSIQLLYNSVDSSLYLKWSDANYNKSFNKNKRCLFPLLSDDSTFKSEVFTLVPPSAKSSGASDDIWDSQTAAYDFIRKDCLLDNKDIQTFINRIDTMIRRCELTHQSLKLKMKISTADLVIDAFDPTN